MNDLQSEIQGPMGCLLCLLWGLTRRRGRRLLDGGMWDDMPVLTHKPSEYSPTSVAPIFPLPLSCLGLYNSCLFIKNSAILKHCNNQETTC